MSASFGAAERERFWSKVAPPDSGGCRLWLGALNAEQRGRHTIDGRTRYAYVYALEMSGTEVQAGAPVRHLCNNPSCCEPSHLTTAGGQSANNRDAVAAGTHRSAVLTPADARRIRFRLASSHPPRQLDLAREYGVSPSAISAVALGRTFPHAGGPLRRSRKRQLRDPP